MQFPAAAPTTTPEAFFPEEGKLSADDEKNFPSNAEIKNICTMIRQEVVKRGSDDELRLELSERFPFFARLLPHLFKAAMNKNFPLDMLDYMLSKSKDLRPDGLGVVDADTDVYTKLQQIYSNKK